MVKSNQTNSLRAFNCSISGQVAEVQVLVLKKDSGLAAEYVLTYSIMAAKRGMEIL